MKPKRKRWVCPLCRVGALGPLRPRKDNALRYCLPCTAKTGKLTERVAPADQAKKEKKAQALKDKKAKKGTKRKARTTKRSWINNPKYVFMLNDKESDGHTLGINIMVIAERMCRSKRWNTAYCKAKKHKPFDPAKESYYNSPNQRLSRLWNRTMDYKGKPYPGDVLTRSHVSIRISRSKSSGYSSGLGGPDYGVSMKAGHSIPDVMVCLLHELVHVIQGTYPRVNGKKRPHDLAFNSIMCSMAKSFWGYPYTPHQAGYSIGKGYAPTRHMGKWLKEQIASRNPKIMKWFTLQIK